ncbi:MAG TPA: glycosyltransferase [Solirubrobacterales bacterium]|jgi:GT2 family glycosyltransferase
MAARLRRPALTRRGRAASRTVAAEVEALPSRPLISVVMPAYETDPKLLREAIDSVRHQRYPDWELCIADDGSPSGRVRRVLDRYRDRDRRIKVTYLERNRGISAATNAALELAAGEFVAFLDHDDMLPSDALLRVAQALGDDPELDLVYSDSDKLTLHGTRADPFFKPDWSPTYALGAMYVGHLLVVRRSLAEQVGGFDSAYDKIQDFEFMLRVSERTDRIHHIPLILYHWRAIPGSIAAGAEQKSGVPELQAKAVSAHLRRIGVAAVAVPHQEIPHRAQLAPDPELTVEPAELAASVSVVIAWRGGEGLERLLASLFGVSAHPPGEVIVVAADAPAAAELAGAHPVRVVEDSDDVFSRSRAANRGAAEAGGEWLLFCSDAAEIVEPGWLAELHLHASLPGTAAAGPLISRPDGRTEAAGFAVALDHPVEPMLAGVDAAADGYYGALVCARDVSAISAEFMLIRRSAFERAAGFEENYATGYEDFDLCQRLRALGLGVVYAARPRVVVHETPAARLEALDIVDRALFVDRWYDQLAAGDPFFNPNFARREASFVPG